MLRLRTATPDDHGVVADIIYRSYSVLMADAYKPEQLAAVLPAITKPNPVLLSSDHYFIVYNDGAAVGCGGWSSGTPGTGHEVPGLAHIRHFAVVPEGAGKGVGRLLFSRCADEAAASGFRRMQAYSSLNAITFYERLGFQKREPIDVQMTDQIKFPGMVMERNIPRPT